MPPPPLVQEVCCATISLSSSSAAFDWESVPPSPKMARIPISSPLLPPFSLSLQRCLSIPRTLKVHSGVNSNGRSLGGREEGPKWKSTHGPFFSSPLWPFPEDFFFLFFFFIFSADPRRERKIEGGGELLFLFPPRVRKFEGRGAEIVFHSLFPPPPSRNFRKGKREY